MTPSGDAATGARPADRVVDAIGLLCPLPILELERAAARRHAGEVLLLLASDEGIHEDLPAWCSGQGHELIELREASPDDPIIRGWLRLGPTAPG